MQIHQRINSRKLLLSYLYHYCFFARLASSVEAASKEQAEISPQMQNDPFFDQTFLADIKTLWENSAKEGERFKANVVDILMETTEDEIPYYLKNFFDQWKDEDIDIDYVLKVWTAFPRYVSEVKTAINQYAESFSYEQMDVIDQAIFLLGYTEWKVLETPKEILMNEMIELAKRYSDEGAPKLINGIMHKLMNAGLEKDA